MEGMRFEAPDSVDAAVALLATATGEARVLAGGTDLLVQLRADMIEPELIVDIKRISETRTVTEEDGGYRVGAAVAGAELKEHPSFSKTWPGVMYACDLIGSTQIQGRCTMAGNLCNASPAGDSVPAMVAAGAIARIAGSNGGHTRALRCRVSYGYTWCIFGGHHSVGGTKSRPRRPCEIG